MNKLRQTWIALGSSLWFVPALLALAGVGLALLLVEADARVPREALLEWPRLFGGGAGGARGMLSAIAGSTVTVVGVTFSITIVALSLASSQYTSRVLRNFMKDGANQFALGVFAGLFAYCLVVLRTIRDTDEGRFVPSLAVLFGVVLALFGVGVLIYFLHHIASSIQASSVVAAVYTDTIKSVDHLFPKELGDGAEDEGGAGPGRDPSRANWHALAARATGYVQGVDEDALLAFARKRGAVVRMERGVGEFVVEGAALASVAGVESLDESDGAALNDAYALSRFRTVEQDAAFGVRQIVDIALKALSPGVNDTTTAVVCVDYLSAILARVARRRVPARFRYEGGELRVVAKGPTFAALVSEAFDQIRQNARDNPAVLARLLGGIETAAAFTRNEARRAVLREQVELVAAQAERTVESGHDLEAVRTQAAAARRALERGAGAGALMIEGVRV
jgi:uncharacterized membrane protein